MIITTIKGERIDLGDQPEYSLKVPYSKGAYNKFDDEEQHIRISEGCPNRCVYCAESWENGTKPIYYDIPEIIRNNVKILDMNLMYKDKCIEILDDLGRRKVNNKCVKYELQCGIDWRYMNQDKASALKRNRFQRIRLAWDYSYKDVYKIADCIKYLTNAGYNPKHIQVFMICNWKVPFYEVKAKLETLKKWNVEISDCWFDNQLPPNIDPIYWTKEQIKWFRKQERNNGIMNRHNGIQVEYMKEKKTAGTKTLTPSPLRSSGDLINVTQLRSESPLRNSSTLRPNQATLDFG